MDKEELDKQFQAMESDTQVQAADAGTPPAPPKKKRITVAELSKAIDDIRDVKLPETLDWLAELAIRLDNLEGKAVENLPSFVPDINARLDNYDAAIGALADALRSHIEKPAATPQPPETEMEFAEPPQQMAGGTDDISAIAVVASVCQTMTDVLTITRALKEVPELTDAERKEILYIAGRASGVIITPGLRIRAGVKFTGA